MIKSKRKHIILGAIAGDVFGSIYEFNNLKTSDFNLFNDNCKITDDTVLSIAITDSLLNNCNFKNTVFEGDVNFEDCVFFEDADFSGAVFKGKANFKGVNWNPKGKLNFLKTKFEGDADFSSIKCKRLATAP